MEETAGIGWKHREEEKQGCRAGALNHKTSWKLIANAAEVVTVTPQCPPKKGMGLNIKLALVG